MGSVGLHHVDIREFLTGSEELTQLSFLTFVLVIFLLLLFLEQDFAMYHSLTWNRNPAFSSSMLVLQVCPIIFGLIINF